MYPFKFYEHNEILTTLLIEPREGHHVELLRKLSTTISTRTSLSIHRFINVESLISTCKSLSRVPDT